MHRIWLISINDDLMQFRSWIMERITKFREKKKKPQVAQDAQINGKCMNYFIEFWCNEFCWFQVSEIVKYLLMIIYKHMHHPPLQEHMLYVDQTILSLLDAE